MYVNTGQAKTPSRFGGSRPGKGEKNCALCAAAGAVNLATSTRLTTRDVAGKKPGLARDLSEGTSVDEQAREITEFVCETTKRSSQQLGKMAQPFQTADQETHEKLYWNALKWMNEFKDGTVYAVYVSGPLKVGGGSTRSHWLSALKAGGTVRYFDFQANREFQDVQVKAIGGQNPPSATIPILGIESQASGDGKLAMHSDSQSGAFDVGRTKCVVIAFPPTKA